MNEVKKKKWELYMSVAVLVCAFIVSQKDLNITASNSQQDSQPNSNCIVIDAGHGGVDPGKVSITGTNEKEINLAIAKKVQEKLIKQGFEVVMTRETDEGLYDSSTTNKKVEDMKRRCQKIDQANPLFTVSIHQNSYHEASVSGAQVFYYARSKEGSELATVLQEMLVEQVDPGNHRKAKANETYYLLKKTKRPTVIVECGFLSNWEEAKKLETEEYQELVAEAVCKGIVEYVKQSK